MGTIVLKERSSDGSFEVIDGQQRLATLSVLALAIIRAVRNMEEQGIDAENNAQRVRLLKDRLISAKHPASLKEESRLKLNRHDDGFFQSYLVQLVPPRNPSKLKGSERRLWQAFEYFSKQVDTKLADTKDGAALAAFLTDTVAAGVQFIKIQVQDDLSAYTVFETLNARGLQLTATDLLKNYLFSLVAQSSTDLDLIETAWTRLIGRVAMEDFPDFLYHYLVSVGVDARKQRLFADLRSRVTSREDVFDWVERLYDAAEWYVALSDPNDELWTEYAGARPYVRELVLFNVDQYKPLILAARDQIRSRAIDSASLLRLCSVMSLRATIVGRRNTADVLRAYQAAVAAVLHKRPWSVADVFDAMRTLYPADDDFQASFANASFAAGGARRRIVKFLLCALEESFGATRPDFDADPATVEHILPENPSADWAEAFSEDDQERFAHRLGNLTLLEPALNRQIGNASFAAKRQVYPTSRYAMTREIADSQWNAATVRGRQQDLARRAVRVFRLDF
jgi:hypothetical protein